MTMRIARLVGLGLLLGPAACLDKGDYPSLRPRAFEGTGAGVPLPPPPPAAPPSAQTLARVAALVDRAEAGNEKFSAELVRARPVIARAGAADSETWITAQEQLSALDASRAEALAASAELDALNLAGVDAAGLRFAEADFAAIRAGADQVGALLQAQGRTLSELAATISPP